MMAFRIRKGWPPGVTTPSPARPICCGPTGMSPRVLNTRRDQRSTPPWRARAAWIEAQHGIVDQLEFRQAGRRFSRRRRGASRLERRSERRSGRGAGADPGQSYRRHRRAGGGDRTGETADARRQPATTTATTISAKGLELMAKGFASTTDMAEKKITFSEIGTDLYAFTAEGDPNSAVIVGDDG